MLGDLRTTPARDRPDLVGAPVAAALARLGGEVHVAEIDPALSDTAAFCDRYRVEPSTSANCVVVAASRGGETRLAACVVLATTRADVNGVVRRHLAARKVSFAPTGTAVEQTGMEHGAITPVGLPEGWPVLLDAAVAGADLVVVGSGVRRSKLVLAGALLAALPGVEVLDLAVTV